jgi:hypothetical protein
MASTTNTVLKALVFSLAGLILVVLGVGLLLADEWEVRTSRTVGAPPEQVRARIGDLTGWAKWSAWDLTVGAQAQRSVEGAPGTVGQRIVWSGSHGRWSLTVTALTADALSYRYERVADADQPPLPGTNTGEVTWAADGAGTRVTWIDRGTWETLPLRWFGWFGAIQERVREMQSATLVALADELERAGR